MTVIRYIIAQVVTRDGVMLTAIPNGKPFFTPLIMDDVSMLCVRSFIVILDLCHTKTLKTKRFRSTKAKGL